MTQVQTRSASGMWRHANCTGNVLLEQSLEADGVLAAGNPTRDSTIGQRIHSMLEGFTPDDITYEEGTIADMCDMLAQMAEAEFFGDKNSTEIFKEERLNYVFDNVIFFSGKPDRVAWDEEHALALNVNYKTGRKESISAAENLQLRTEVVLIARAYNDPHRIGATIVEPLVTKKPEIVVYDRASVAKAEAEILEIVDRTFWEPARTAGPWCVHCPCRAHCPEAHKYAIDFPTILTVKALPSGQDGADFLARLKTAQKVIDTILSLYRALVLDNPSAIPGWWVSPGDQIRIVDAEKMMTTMSSEHMAFDDFYMCVTFHLGKLKELWRMHSSKDFDETFRHTWTLKRKNGSLEPIPKRLK